MTAMELENLLAELHDQARKALLRGDHHEYAWLMNEIIMIREDLQHG